MSEPASRYPMFHMRLDPALMKEIDHLGVDLELDRSRTVMEILKHAKESGVFEALKAEKEVEH